MKSLLPVCVSLALAACAAQPAPPNIDARTKLNAV
jgi:hypothetical protein